MNADCFLVTEDQDAIADAIKLSIAQANVGLDGWLDPSRCIHGFGWVRQFQLNSAEVLQRSEAIRREPVCFERFERMIQLLISLRHPKWIELFEIIIRGAPTDSKAKLLRNIRDRLTGDSRAIWAHAAVADHFLPAIYEAALSEEYEMRARAMHLLADIDDPNAKEALFSAVLAGLQTGWVYRMVLETLFLGNFHDARTVRFADRIASLILSKEINTARNFASEERAIMYNLARLLKLCAQEGDALVRQQSSSISTRVFVAWKQDGSKYQRENLATLAMAIGLGATDEHIDWLHCTFKRERHTHSAAGLLVGLVRLCGKQGRELLIDALNDSKRRKTAWQACSIALKETGDSEVLATIELSAAKIASPSDLKLAAEAVFAIGQEQADQLIDAWKDRLDSFDYYRLTVNRQPQKSDLAGQDAVSLGLIKQDTLKGAMKLNGSHLSCGLVSHAFWLEGRAAYVSSLDTGELLYQSLLTDFKAASNGTFSPTFPSQTSAGETGDYQLRFLHGGLLYEAKLRGGVEGANGFTYDAYHFVSLINKALAEAETRERFIGINNRSGYSPFVFADPLVLLPFAEKHHITLLPTELWLC